MRKFLYIVTTLCLLVACNKEEIRTREEAGGTRTVGVSSGAFPVLVTTEGVWMAESDDAWIHIDDSWHKNKASFYVQYDSNESTDGDRRFNRVGTIRVKTWDGAIVKTISLRQYGLEPFISLPDTKISTAGGRQNIPFLTNLTDRERPSLVFTSDSPSLIAPIWDEDGESVSFDTTEGTTGGVIQVQFTDAWGKVFTASATITRE